MDITTDTSIPAQRSLFLLYPFLLGGQLFQLYNAYTLFQQQHRSTIVDTESSIAVDEWYALASAALFFTLGSGNIIATSWIYAGKIRRRVVGGGDAGHAGADSTCVTPS